MVDRPGFEPGTEACKATVFPTIPTAHISFAIPLQLAVTVGFEPTARITTNGTLAGC